MTAELEVRSYGPEARTRMGFFTDTSVCIGCKACEVACKEWNHVPEDGLVHTGMSMDARSTSPRERRTASFSTPRCWTPPRTCSWETRRPAACAG